MLKPEMMRPAPLRLPMNGSTLVPTGMKPPVPQISPPAVVDALKLLPIR